MSLGVVILLAVILAFLVYYFLRDGCLKFGGFVGWVCGFVVWFLLLHGVLMLAFVVCEGLLFSSVVVFVCDCLACEFGVYFWIGLLCFKLFDCVYVVVCLVCV